MKKIMIVMICIMAIAMSINANAQKVFKNTAQANIIRSKYICCWGSGELKLDQFQLKKSPSTTVSGEYIYSLSIYLETLGGLRTYPVHPPKVGKKEVRIKFTNNKTLLVLQFSAEDIAKLKEFLAKPAGLSHH